VTRRITFLLVIVNLLLALLLAALWLAPGPAAQWRDWQPPAPQPPNLDDARTALITSNPAAAADYPDVLERPLLMPARRPAASDPAAAAAPPPTAIEQVTFTGIIAGPTLTGVMLQEKDQPRFVRLGEAVGDWTLDAIDGRTITFKRGAERKQINLPYADMSTPGKGAAKPPAPGAPPKAAAPPPAAPPLPAPMPPQSTPAPIPPAPAVAPPAPSAAATDPAANAPDSAPPARPGVSVAPLSSIGGIGQMRTPPAKGGKP